jgi:spore germination protein GerM
MGNPEKKKNVFLYFSDSECEYLVAERREIFSKTNVKEEAKETINELIKGPKSELVPTISPQTKLLDLQIQEEGLATVDFDKTLASDHPGGSSAEILTIYSIVNSLNLNFPQIKRVWFLVEGQPVESIAGHLSLKKPVSPDPYFIKKKRRKR